MIVRSSDKVIIHRYTLPPSGRRWSFLRSYLCYRWIWVLARTWICFWFIANLMAPTPWQVWAVRNRNVLAPVVFGRFLKSIFARHSDWLTIQHVSCIQRINKLRAEWVFGEISWTSCLRYRSRPWKQTSYGQQAWHTSDTDYRSGIIIFYFIQQDNSTWP